MLLCALAVPLAAPAVTDVCHSAIWRLAAQHVLLHVQLQYESLAHVGRACGAAVAVVRPEQQLALV